MSLPSSSAVLVHSQPIKIDDPFYELSQGHQEMLLWSWVAKPCPGGRYERAFFLLELELRLGHRPVGRHPCTCSRACHSANGQIHSEIITHRYRRRGRIFVPYLTLLGF